MPMLCLMWPKTGSILELCRLCNSTPWGETLAGLRLLTAQVAVAGTLDAEVSLGTSAAGHEVSFNGVLEGGGSGSLGGLLNSIREGSNTRWKHKRGLFLSVVKQENM